MKTKDLLSVLILGICQICGQNSSTLSPLASSRPGAFALMSLVLIRPPGELLAIGGRVQIGIPRFAEGNLAPLPKMSQIARRHLHDLACLITPQPLPFAGIRLGNLRIIHGIFLLEIHCFTRTSR